MNIQTYFFTARAYFREHKWGVVVAVCIGFIVVAPQVFFISSLGSNYKGLYLMNTDAETHYIARIQEIYDGNGTGNPYLYEYKNLPSPLFTYSEAILAYPGILFGVSAVTMNLIYKFLLPALIAFLIYSLFFRLTANKLWSIAGVSLLMLGYSLINIPDIIHLLQMDTYYTDLIMYSRPVNPQFSAILLFIYLHLALSLFKDVGLNGVFRRSNFVILGLVLGLAFYSYLYSFTFFLAMNAVCIIYFLLTRDTKRALGMIVSSLIGCVIGMFFIIHMFKVAQSPYYADLANILGAQHSHVPIISIAGVITLIIFLLYYWKSSRTQIDNFLLILLITTFVVVNQQVITGTIVQTGHYHWYFNSPIYFITLIYVACQFLRNKPRILHITLSILIIVISVADASFIQYSAYQAVKTQTAENQRYVPVFDWLKKNTVPESVVFANTTLSGLIPAFTSNNVVWYAPAQFYLLPPERILFNQDNLLASSFDFSKYGEYRLDYLIWDIKIDPVWNINHYAFFEIVAKIGDFQIFKRIMLQ